MSKRARGLCYLARGGGSFWSYRNDKIVVRRNKGLIRFWDSQPRLSSCQALQASKISLPEVFLENQLHEMQFVIALLANQILNN